MARSYWGKVYLGDDFVGQLREEPGGRCTFTYEKAYLEGKGPRLSDLEEHAKEKIAIKQKEK